MPIVNRDVAAGTVPNPPEGNTTLFAEGGIFKAKAPDGTVTPFLGEPGATGAASTVPGPQGEPGVQGVQGNPGADSTVPGPGVPSGGTAGQVLAKVDGDWYNTNWVTPGGGTPAGTTGSVQYNKDNVLTGSDLKYNQYNDNALRINVANSSVELGNNGQFGGPNLILLSGSSTGATILGNAVDVPTPYALTISAYDSGLRFSTGNNTPRLVIDAVGTWLLAGDAGTAGQVLSSAGTGATPTWETAGGGIDNLTVTGAITTPIISAENSLTINAPVITLSPGNPGAPTFDLTTTSMWLGSGGNPLPFHLYLSELNINGAPGTAGQVLTSQGPGLPPIWTTPA